MGIDTLVSIVVTIALFLLGGYITFQNGRINDLIDKIDKVKDDYLRRDDADGKLGRMEKSMDEVRGDVKVLTGLVLKGFGKD